MGRSDEEDEGEAERNALPAQLSFWDRE
jgi:hypothetical protein